MILSKDINKFCQKILNRRIEKTNLKYLIEALDEVYPDRWDLQFNANAENSNGYDSYNSIGRHQSLTDYLKNNRCFYYDLIVYYPEIIITNGKLSHKLTDLYVKLNIIDKIKHNTVWIDYIVGTRASQTVEELRRGYRHSHLTIGWYPFFTGFCLGSGPINKFINNADIDSKDEWVYFLLLLDNYLKWESKAGVPYVYMDSIRGMEPISVNTSYAHSVINQVKFSNLNFKITDSNIEVINDNNIEQRIFEYLNSLHADSYLCYKTSDGRYVSKAKITNENEFKYLDNKPMKFTFKGEQVKFKITNTENIINYEYNAPNPNLTKEVCRQLSKQITKKHITNSRVIKKDRAKDTQESITPDKVSV